MTAKTGCSSRTIALWKQRFEANGVAGLRRGRYAVLAAVGLVVSPAAHAPQNSALPGVTTSLSMVVRCAFRPSDWKTAVQEQPVIVFEAGATNSLEVWGGILPQVASMAPSSRTIAPGWGVPSGTTRRRRLGTWLTDFDG